MVGQSSQGAADNTYLIEVAAYFAPPATGLFELLEGLLSAVLTAFDDHAAHVSFGSRGRPDLDPAEDWQLKELSGRLGDLARRVRSEAPPLDQIRWSIAEDDHRWSLSLSDAERIDGLPADPVLSLVLGEHSLGASRNGPVPALLQSVFECIDSSNQCYFGLIDGIAKRAGGGTIYGDAPTRPLDWRTEVSHIDWLSLGDQRRGVVRDVYWGLYLSRDHLDRLPTTFCNQFLMLDTDGVRPQSLTRFDSGAGLLLMSSDPLDAPAPFPAGDECPAVRNAVWVRQQLRQSGLL